MTRTETFVSYRRFRWMWITCLLLAVCVFVYFLNEPVGGRNGGTVVGYVFGVLATVAIIWLMLYGLRKRAYRSSLGTVEGWLAAHVWIGIGLTLLVPLHAGFSFGMNVHTAAYVCMILTIVTGVWGVVNYTSLSSRISSHRGGVSDSTLLEQMYALREDLERLCAGKSSEFLRLFNTYDFTFRPGLLLMLRGALIPSISQSDVSPLIQDIAEAERSDAVTLLRALDERVDLANAVVEQARIKFLLKAWLYIHVPVSIALCVTVAVHIFSVFFYW